MVIAFKGSDEYRVNTAAHPYLPVNRNFKSLVFLDMVKGSELLVGKTLGSSEPYRLFVNGEEVLYYK